MALTREQFQELRNKGLSVDQIISFEKGETSADLTRQKQVKEQIAGNQFEQEKPTGFFGKARDVITGFIGGGKLAEGVGQALANTSISEKIPLLGGEGVQKTLSEEQRQTEDLQAKLLQQIRENRASGLDTSRLEKALKGSQDLATTLQDAQKDFGESLVTPKEVIGSAARLAATASGGFLAKQAAKAMALGKATGFVSGALRGAGAGAITGAVEGGIQGAGLAAEQDKGAKEIALAGGLGVGIGAGTGGLIGGVVGGISGKLRASRALREQKIELLKTHPDSRVAQYTLTGEGKIATDPIAKEAIKQGIDEGTVATIKGASSADKIKANEMVDILEKGRFDPKYKAVNRPSDIIGGSVMERFDVVHKANQKAAQQLDVVAGALRGQKIDPTPAVQSFLDDLGDMGIEFKKGTPIFKGSDIEGIKPAENLVNRVVKRMSEVSDDANELHKLKKFIDEQVAYGKSSEGLTGNTERIIKGLRANIDDLLDTNFAQYNKVNTQYANTRKALDQFAESAGARFNAKAPNIKAKIGTLARRILSNAQSRTDVLNSLQNLQDVAEKYGGKFKDDIITQTVFVNDLERLFGTQAPTSLAGEVAKGVQRAEGIIEGVKTSQGLFEIAKKGVVGTIEKARGINEENLIKAIRALLK